ncbi:hypothetical protein COCCADRAFT_85431, partial [Bipolaris zeicola 26-R-13]
RQPGHEPVHGGQVFSYWSPSPFFFSTSPTILSGFFLLNHMNTPVLPTFQTLLYQPHQSIASTGLLPNTML